MEKSPNSSKSMFLSCRSGNCCCRYGNELLPRLLVYLVWFSFLVLPAGHAQNCSEDEEFTSTVQMVLRSKLLIFGKVIQKYPDERYDYGSGTEVYTAEMEVFCVLKGPRTSRFVNITEAGYIPGHCISTTLLLNQTFIVIADYNGSTYRPVDTEIAATSSNLAEVSTACGLDPKYPDGVSEKNASKPCLTPALPSQCKDETYYRATTTTTTTMPSTVDEEIYGPYDELYSSNANVPNDPNGKHEMTSQPDGNPTFSKSSASLAYSPRSSDCIRVLHVMTATAVQLLLAFLPLGL